MKIAMSLMVLMLILLGCSEKIRTVTVVKKTVCPTLQVVSVDFNGTIPTFEPKDISVTGNGERVELSVNSLMTIKKIMKRLRVQHYVLWEVYKFNLEQIKKYNKEFVDADK